MSQLQLQALQDVVRAINALQQTITTQFTT